MPPLAEFHRLHGAVQRMTMKPAVVPPSLPPMGKVDSAKNACIVSPKTDEVLDARTTLNAAEARGGRLGRTSSAPSGGTFPTGGRLDGGTDVVEVVVTS